MIKPNHELHKERMTAIGLAIKATKEAMEIGTSFSYLGKALSSLRIARLETWVDYRRRLEVWRQEETAG